jgi:hypothetical protein
MKQYSTARAGGIRHSTEGRKAAKADKNEEVISGWDAVSESKRGYVKISNTTSSSAKMAASQRIRPTFQFIRV